MWNNEAIQKCRKAAAEGAVLLENSGGLLPLAIEKTVAVFGRTQMDTYRSGTGSGGAVKNPYQVNFIQGLQNASAAVHRELWQVYEKWHQENPFDTGGQGWAAEPWYQKEMPVSDELAKKISEEAAAALVIIGRTAGEDKDNCAEKGSYYLTDEEVQLLKTVCKYFQQVVIVLNVSNIIDMSWLDNPAINPPARAVLYAWHGGMEGGNSICDILYGRVTPSGKLPDTIAYRIEDYPSTEGFTSEGSITYKEDIYVGYRYFETFKPEAVRYPFGFGLSYTSFSIAPNHAFTDRAEEGGKLHITADITNIGAYAGKETLQLYYEAPQGKLGKPKRVLGSFVKTKTLKPGESQQLTITMPLARMASYDDSGVTGHASCYVLEEGLYRFYLGNSVRHASPLSINGNDGVFISQLQVIERLEPVMPPQQEFTRLKPGEVSPDGTYKPVYEAAPIRPVDLKERMASRLPEEIPFTGNMGYTLQDAASQKVSYEAFVAQLTDEEMATMVRGEGMGSLQVTPGTAAAFGGLSQSLRTYGIPVACAADGPSGIRMAAEATLVPIGTLLAATWNTALVEELYGIIGGEMARHKVDMLLGPGMNIHRNPLNGRNFEYYSEDPLLTGKFAAAMTKGLAKHGAHATLKHLICNNREQDRHRINAIVSERSIREIYLKGFEIAVKEGGAKAIMTAYNPINGYYAASNYDLTTTVLRGEWGFDGLVMTDWWTALNDVYDGGEMTRVLLSNMVKAQNDLYMVVENNGAATNVNEDDLLTALAGGKLTRGELQRCVIHIVKLLTTTLAYQENHLYQDICPAIAPLAESPGEPSALGATGLEVPVADKEPVLVRVEQEGIYEIKLVYRLDKSNLAQSRGAFVINTPVEPSIFLLNGSNGEEKEKLMGRVRLSGGLYRFAVVGFEDPIDFVKLRFMPVSLH